MTIDVHLYHLDHSDYGGSFLQVDDADGGYLCEQYFASEHFATKVLFEEAWSQNMYHWNLKGEVLAARLPKALEENKARHSDDLMYAAQIAEQIKKMVNRYVKEYQDGYDPFVTVSY